MVWLSSKEIKEATRVVSGDSRSNIMHMKRMTDEVEINILFC